MNDTEPSVCSYCDSQLLFSPQVLMQKKVSPRKDMARLSPLPASLSQYETPRFELSMLEQTVPNSGPEWFHPCKLEDESFALLYMRLVDEDKRALPWNPKEAFGVLLESLIDDQDPGLAAYLVLEHLGNQGFRDLLELVVLLFDSERSTVSSYNAGCPGCLLLVSQEEGRTIQLGRAYEPLQRRMLRETKDHFSPDKRHHLAAEDLVVLVSAGYAGRGGGTYSSGLGALTNNLNANLGDHPLRVVTLAKNAFWDQRPPAVEDELPHSDLRVAAVRSLRAAAADTLPENLELTTFCSGPYEFSLYREPQDQVELLELHGDRSVLVWVSSPELRVDEENFKAMKAAILAILDRPDYGDNENPRRAGREALELLAEYWQVSLAVIQFLNRTQRIKYFRHLWQQPIVLGSRGIKAEHGMQQFDQGGEVTVGPGGRLFFPGSLEARGAAQTAEQWAELWPGGKSSALYCALVAHWRTRSTPKALERLALAALGDQPSQPTGLALITNTERI